MRVEQTLHGYSDGHRLLAASVDLSRDAKHTMLILSDISGRGIVNGFEEYLTGYPLPGSDWYAFAKTWYAPEMDRPGCVWTHTLLLEIADIGSLSDLGVLRGHFHRPEPHAIREQYGHSLESSMPSHVPTFAYEPDVPFVSDTVAALYGSPDAPIFLPAHDSLSLSNLVIALWNQQWPRLRGRFSFCTGSISSRTVAGRPLDLQVIPHVSIREIRRDVSGATFIEHANSTDPNTIGSWIAASVADLTLNHNGQLREFLSRAGDAVGGREAFAPLVELHFCMGAVKDRTITFHELVDLIGERFPISYQGRHVKKFVLSEGALGTRYLFPDQTEFNLLEALATTRSESAFDANELDVVGRSHRLWRQCRETAEKLIDALLHRDHNTLGETILSAFISAVPPEEIPSLFGDKPEIMSSVVRRNPEVAAIPTLWRGPADYQRELFDSAMAGRQVDEALGARVTVAMLTARSDAAADQVFTRFRESTVETILGWFDRSNLELASELLPGWRRGVGRYWLTVLHWLSQPPSNPRPATVALAARIIDPHASEVRLSDLHVWLRAVSDSSLLDSEARIWLDAFALALSLDSATSQSRDLAVTTFEHVHDAAATGRLDYDSWLLFENHVPVLSAWRNWDKCERLRRGLVDQFERQQWPSVQFLRCASRTDTFRLLLQTCSDYKTGKQLLKRIRHEREAIISTLPDDRIGLFRYYV